MTDEKLRELAEFYDELREAQCCREVLKNWLSFGLASGTQYCELPRKLQNRIRIVILNYCLELEEKMKEL